jgi:hypothetical protein
MKRLVLLLVVALVLTVNFTALSWGGIDLSQWGVFGTNEDPPK